MLRSLKTFEKCVIGANDGDIGQVKDLYFGYTAYWGGPGMWGGGMIPMGMYPGYAGLQAGGVQREQAIAEHPGGERERHKDDDPHLRRCAAVVGYHLQATDGELGHVEGFLVDDETIIAMRSFGLSAPGKAVEAHFGFDAAHVVAAARRQLARHGTAIPA